ncbi:MAG: hypothetical protein ACK44N_04005 [Bacteroidota bacterium]|jgi:hypothetical protein
MIKKHLLLLAIFCFFTTTLSAQKKAPASSKTPIIKFCNASSDTARTNKMTLANLQEWSNSPKVMVKCSDGKSYTLHQFGIQVIVKSPMEVKDFGLGLDGFPIMAKRSIGKLLPGDTVYLKDVVGFDDKGSEIKLPGIAIAVTE